jgi:diphthamide biosynthesis enzyme Dph1/Dph2-like protein
MAAHITRRTVASCFQVLYVFVEIQFDTSHLVAVLKKHFQPESRISLMGTIQFTNALHRAHQELASTFPSMRIPQGKPLSPGKNTALCAVTKTAWAGNVVRNSQPAVMFMSRSQIARGDPRLHRAYPSGLRRAGLRGRRTVSPGGCDDSEPHRAGVSL